MKKTFFITGIGTDVGKTVVASILSEALFASYWKPIQAGNLNNSDSQKVKEWTNNVDVLDEKYRLQLAESPHSAARAQGTIIFPDFPIPQCNNNLIIEGAGGILVPFNDNGNTWIDWVKLHNIPVIIVIKHYLGSINHTLLTINQLKQHKITIMGLIVSGQRHIESERIIKKISHLNVFLHVPFHTNIDTAFITQIAHRNSNDLHTWLIG